MKNLIKNKKASGFTIIEVMIVLAIAGLIMVIVFIAVPQLQRNQRDNARQNAVNRLKAELDTYASNNQGQYPFKIDPGSVGTTGDLADFYQRYIVTPNVNLNNPKDGNRYTLNYATTAAQVPSDDQILIFKDSTCNGENITAGTLSSTTTRKYALKVSLDRTGTSYCVDNG